MENDKDEGTLKIQDIQNNDELYEFILSLFEENKNEV